VRYSFDPLDREPRVSHEVPVQLIGPCTMCATSHIGSRALRAPSKQQPPWVAPGWGRAQVFFRRLWYPQDGSLRRAASSFARIGSSTFAAHGHRHCKTSAVCLDAFARERPRDLAMASRTLPNIPADSVRSRTPAHGSQAGSGERSCRLSGAIRVSSSRPCAWHFSCS
jgi:hypothetical protein